LALLLCIALLPQQMQAKPADWAAEIDTLTAADAARPPAPHGIVFVGSSSIRLWTTLELDFPGLPVIRRGFGGSALADSVFYLDRLVLAYRPDTIVLYAGENELKGGRAPAAIAADFDEFCTKVHAALPGTRIIYLAMKPSPARWALHEKMEQGNALIAAACAHDPRLVFVDTYHALLGPDGQPRPELYRDDQLHLKPASYALWVQLLMPLLKR
jgi:lysophospholipase L1-like esterase